MSTTTKDPSPWEPMEATEDEIYQHAGRVALLTYWISCPKPKAVRLRAEHIAERRELVAKMADLCRPPTSGVTFEPVCESADYRRPEQGADMGIPISSE